MNLAVLILLAISLAMDAFAVSIANGISMNHIKFSQAIIIALFFGVFQAVMPIIGWVIGNRFKDVISGFDYWIIFVILLVIGGKMIYDSLKKEEQKKDNKSLNIYTLFILAIATSIDALAVGLGFSFIDIGIIFPSIIIGIVTFAISLTGVYLGKKLGKLFGKKMEILGGIILILIAFNILLENVHVF